MHILSHLRERSLQRYRMTPLVFQGEARVDIEEILIADMKQSQMETGMMFLLINFTKQSCTTSSASSISCR